jgi:hypothetical protein
MTVNEFPVWLEILGILGGALILLLFGLTFALRNGSSVESGSSGHRDVQEEGHEEIRPDGYIDSFAGVIEEAGGGLPFLVKIALPGIIIWWLVYLILNWNAG